MRLGADAEGLKGGGVGGKAGKEGIGDEEAIFGEGEPVEIEKDFPEGGGWKLVEVIWIELLRFFLSSAVSWEAGVGRALGSLGFNPLGLSLVDVSLLEEPPRLDESRPLLLEVRLPLEAEGSGEVRGEAVGSAETGEK